MRFHKAILAGFSLILATSAQAGFDIKPQYKGTVENFNQSTVTLRDAKGQVWAIDRQALPGELDLRPGQKLTVSVPKERAHLLKPAPEAQPASR